MDDVGRQRAERHHHAWMFPETRGYIGGNVMSTAEREYVVLVPSISALQVVTSLMYEPNLGVRGSH